MTARPHFTTEIPMGKHVAYNRANGDHDAFFDSQYIGSRETAEEARELVNEYVYDLERSGMMYTATELDGAQGEARYDALDAAETLLHTAAAEPGLSPAALYKLAEQIDAAIASDRAERIARWAGVLENIPAETGLICNHPATDKETYLSYGAVKDGGVELDIDDRMEPQVFFLGYEFRLSDVRGAFAELAAIMNSPLVASLEAYDARRVA